MDEIGVRVSARDEASVPIARVRKELRALEAQTKNQTRAQNQARDAQGRFIAGTNQLTHTTRKSREEIKRQREEVKRAAAQKRAWMRVVRGTDSSMKSLSRSTVDLAQNVGRRLVQGFAAATAAATYFGIKSAASFEQSRVAFETILGPSQGRDLYKRLIEINKITPFEFGEVASATQRLLRMGFSAGEAEKQLKALLDVAALSGPEASENVQRISLALGQIRGAGQVYGTELRQLVEAGVPAYELLSHATGKSIGELKELAEQGERFAAEPFLSAFANLEGPLAKFAGGAEKQSKTLVGVFSTFKDNINLALADAAGPFAEVIRDNMAQAGSALGEFIGTTLPPLTRLFGTFAEMALSALPVITPLLTAMVDGMVMLANAAKPAFGGMRPVMEQLTIATGEFFEALVPVMPDVVDLMIALVGILPDFVRLLTLMVPLVAPFVRLLAAMLELDGVRPVLAGLLAVLIGYRALSGIAHAVMTFTAAVKLMGAASATTAVQMQAMTTQQRLAALGNVPGGPGLTKLGAAGVGAAGLGATYYGLGNRGAGSDLATVGGMAATGAAVGSIIPGAGTLAGALIGGGVGVGATLFKHHTKAGRQISGGDVVTRPSTMAMANAINAGTPGQRTVTSGNRGWGLASQGSAHADGTGLDITGSHLGAYANNLKKAGGWATVHDVGSGQHLHGEFPTGDVVTRNRTRVAPGLGPGGDTGKVEVNVYYPQREMDIQAPVDRALRNHERRKALRS